VRRSSGEDGVAVAGSDFGSFLQHEGEPGLMRHYTTSENGGSRLVLTETILAVMMTTRGGMMSSGHRR
jgi:hypothetical protein